MCQYGLCPCSWFVREAKNPGQRLTAPFAVRLCSAAGSRTAACARTCTTCCPSSTRRCSARPSPRPPSTNSSAAATPARGSSSRQASLTTMSRGAGRPTEYSAHRHAFGLATVLTDGRCSRLPLLPGQGFPGRSGLPPAAGRRGRAAAGVGAARAAALRPGAGLAGDVARCPKPSFVAPLLSPSTGAIADGWCPTNREPAGQGRSAASWAARWPQHPELGCVTAVLRLLPGVAPGPAVREQRHVTADEPGPGLEDDLGGAQLDARWGPSPALARPCAALRSPGPPLGLRVVGRARVAVKPSPLALPRSTCGSGPGMT
jgi:hypothetical protein